MKTDVWDSLFLIKKAYGSVLEPVCEQFEMTRMELDILLFLTNNPEFDTAADIIERRGLTKSHVSSSLKALESRGYLERFFRPGNRKSAHLKLLPKAEEPVRRGQRAQKYFFETAFQGVDPEELRKTEARIRKISENVRRMEMSGKIRKENRDG